jgi:sarcosine oxidase
VTADVVVVGAGIFGASTAVALQHAGSCRVVLIDAWGVGNPRATSSDQSRVTRTAYGAKRLYTRWSWQSLTIWKQWQRETGVEMFLPTGVLWLAGEDAEFRAASLAAMRELEIPVEAWPAGEAARRFPQFAGISGSPAIYEPEAGLLLARQSLMAVVEMFQRRGGIVETGTARPSAGAYVFACGPWLRTLFPELLQDRLRVTRQEVFYFKTSDASFEPGKFPTWIEEGSQAGLEFSFYGMPRLNGAIKISSDIRGPEFDASSGNRTPSKEGESAARAFVARRIPALAAAELADARVCQYEQTPDSNLIFDRHPERPGVWIVGGGSGHGFKLAPSVGKLVAACILNNSRDGIPHELRLW